MTALAAPPCESAQIDRQAPPAAKCKKGAWVLAATILGSSMVFIDGTVVNVALPVLQSEFGATAAQVQWVVEAYALFLAALLLLGGALADHYGRKRIFIIGVIIFTLSSMLCGAAPNIVFLAVVRAIQGVGGALLAPSSLAIISASFSADERGQAIGTWSAFTAITAAIGPVMGGWLVQHVSWRAVFYLNAPIAVIVLFLTLKHVEESYGDRVSPIDWPGAALVTLGLAGVTYGLISASAAGLSDRTAITTFVLGLLALAIFVVVEFKSTSPMVPPHLFRSSTFSGANILTLLLYGALGGALYFVPFNLIQVQGYTPTAAGAAFLPFILIMFLLSRWSGGLIAKVGARLPLMVGPAIAALGFVLFARIGVGGTYWRTFFPAIVVLGLGMAVVVAPLTTTVLSSVPSEHTGLASGINTAVSRTASLLAVAIFGIVMLSVFTQSLTAQMSTVPATPGQRQAIEGHSADLAAIALPANMSDEAKVAARNAIDSSFVAGFQAVMIASAVLALASTLIAGLMIAGKQSIKAASPQPGTT
jgi:EmrB/QacA subfamily drug resistance transporter